MVNRFSRNLRLNNAVDFSSTFKLGKKNYSQHLVIYCKPNQLTYPRLGLVIARKAVRLAVHRNIIKRLLRETFRCRQQELTGLDVVIVAQRSIHSLTKIDLRVCIEQQWQKVIQNHCRREQ